ncbi:MAG: ATP-binding protein, partial [Chloroflexi bacterium]|nr:ATP-binding protein [Chloroflexota bacterium]
GLVINRLKTDDKQITEFARQCGLDIFGRIPEDEHITDCDSAGKPMLEVPESSPSVKAVREILGAIGLAVAG